MIVFHDRYFMDKLVDHLFVFEGKGMVRDFPGNYNDYRANESGLKSVKKIVQKRLNDQINRAKNTIDGLYRLTFNEKRELEELKKEVCQLEIHKKAIEDDLDMEADYEKLMALGVVLNKIMILTEAKELRWLELS